jgi:ribonucleoside-diphosphate reductase alpha chain
LGTHGLADVFAKLEIKYDSKEAIEFCENLYEKFRNFIYDESCNLAIERGCFGCYDKEKHLNSEYIKRLPIDIRRKIAETGIRNISLLTQAPTGSVSILSKSSSGIEPVFANSYIRRKKKNHDSVNNDSDFVDQNGDRWEEFKVFHPNLEYYLNKFDTKVIPEYFVEAHNIDWNFRVKLQSTIQKYIDHSISSTINLPSNTTSETISQIYMEAWKQGIKGITVYVEGSRTGVLVNSTQNTSFQRKDAPKRPKELECDIHTVTVKGEKYTFFVGLWDGLPYEIMGGKSEYVEIPAKFTKANIVKFHKQQSRYDLIVDEIRINNITKIFENNNYEVLTRMLSLGLRHGANPSFLVEQLLKDPESDFFSFSRAIARVLKKYIADGTKVSSDKICPNCNSDSLRYVEGCVTCSSCGYSKCS